MKVFSLRALLLAASMPLLCPDALAGVVVHGTRVVYPAQAREITVQVTNTGDAPSLIQAWVDSGDPRQTPDGSDAPFVLTPPISRVEPGRGQALRLIFSGAALPADRESLFWLNVLDVPPSPEKSAGGEQNYLQIAIRSRLKLFYRPAGLAGEANEAPAALRWRRDGGRLRVENPTPYHVTLAEVRALAADGGERVVEAQGTMVAPWRHLEFAAPAGTDRVRFLTINDYGGRVERTIRLDDGG
ncbi:molecular chaperone [Lysobacter pythonis]|uniref:Molecular chaperone n=1 Tax=Solilutibacter pythonis TaxID=2483112 RepID=A0A3M2HVI4_9GAMM|nr:molecular chaperone [Lysobacter pythonis]RMH90932.1 molecular chaperone [Lysobacter pythonis]